MSIIYEALQKTQRNRQNKNEIGANLPRRVDLFDLALIAVIISLLSTVGYLYHTRANAPKAALRVSPLTATIPAVAAPVTETASGLTLNGVLVSDDDKIALINNQPLHKGETISGMKIMSIELNKVVLQQGSQAVVLRS